jgi:hypothetical protein
VASGVFKYLKGSITLEGK